MMPIKVSYKQSDQSAVPGDNRVERTVYIIQRQLERMLLLPKEEMRGLFLKSLIIQSADHPSFSKETSAAESILIRSELEKLFGIPFEERKSFNKASEDTWIKEYDHYRRNIKQRHPKMYHAILADRQGSYSVETRYQEINDKLRYYLELPYEEFRMFFIRRLIDKHAFCPSNMPVMLVQSVLKLALEEAFGVPLEQRWERWQSITNKSKDKWDELYSDMKDRLATSQPRDYDALFGKPMTERSIYEALLPKHLPICLLRNL